jgi:hypothetical protein
MKRRVGIVKNRLMIYHVEDRAIKAVITAQVVLPSRSRYSFLFWRGVFGCALEVLKGTLTYVKR